MRSLLIIFTIISLSISCTNSKAEIELNRLEIFVKELRENEFCKTLYEYNTIYNNFNKNNFETYLKQNNIKLYNTLNKSSFTYKIIDTTTIELGILIDGPDHKFNTDKHKVLNGTQEYNNNNLSFDLILNDCQQHFD